MNTLGGQKKTSKNIRNILNFFSYCDGSNSIEDISNFTEIPIKEGLKIFRLLKSKKIVYRV